MNHNPIKQIYNFNKESGLLEQGYSDERECQLPIEQALNGFNTDTLSKLLVPSKEPMSKEEISKVLINYACYSEDAFVNDVDRLNKHLNIIVSSFSSIFKLGLSPQEAMKALGVVMDCNIVNLSSENDIGPGPKLQAILDKIEQ